MTFCRMWCNMRMIFKFMSEKGLIIMKNDYKTRQRTAVLNCLKSNGGHLTAAQISDMLHASGEKAGLATIYRRLDKLVEMGFARKYVTDKGACYQYAENGCRNHFHLQCTRCGTLFHVDCSYMEALAPHIEKHHGFKVDNCRTVLYGICAQCSEKEGICNGGNADDGKKS